MWWFLKKSRPAAAPAKQSERGQAEQSLLDTVPDVSKLNDHHVAIKIWLPERVALTMKWLADYEGISQSNWVRSQLASYVYGRVAVLVQHIRAEKHGILFSRGLVDRGAGRWVYRVPQLGKNTVASKVWVSQQLRDDLQVLAIHAGVTLSPFVHCLAIKLSGLGSSLYKSDPKMVSPAVLTQPTDTHSATCPARVHRVCATLVPCYF